MESAFRNQWNICKIECQKGLYAENNGFLDVLIPLSKVMASRNGFWVMVFLGIEWFGTPTNLAEREVDQIVLGPSRTLSAPTHAIQHTACRCAGIPPPPRDTPPSRVRPLNRIFLKPLKRLIRANTALFMFSVCKKILLSFLGVARPSILAGT